MSIWVIVARAKQIVGVIIVRNIFSDIIFEVIAIIVHIFVRFLFRGHSYLLS